MARPTPRLHLYSQGIVAENSWTLIDPGSMTRIWLVMKSDRLLFFTKPSMDHKPLFTVRLEEILSVHDHMTTIVCIETAERKYYLQRSGVPGTEQSTSELTATSRWTRRTTEFDTRTQTLATEARRRYSFEFIIC